MQEILCFVGITFLFSILAIGLIESTKIKVVTIIGYLILAIVCIIAFKI